MGLDSVLSLAVQVVGLVGLLPPIRKYFAVARRRSRAELISRLVLDGLALAADRKGISPAVASKSTEVLEEIKRKLLGAGVDPAKVEEIAAAALAGAVARLGNKEAARDELLGH